MSASLISLHYCQILGLIAACVTCHFVTDSGDSSVLGRVTWSPPPSALNPYFDGLSGGSDVAPADASTPATVATVAAAATAAATGTFSPLSLSSLYPMFPIPSQTRTSPEIPHSDRVCTATTEARQRCRALASVSVLASYSGGSGRVYRDCVYRRG